MRVSFKAKEGVCKGGSWRVSEPNQPPMLRMNVCGALDKIVHQTVYLFKYVSFDTLLT